MYQINANIQRAARKPEVVHSNSLSGEDSTLIWALLIISCILFVAEIPVYAQQCLHRVVNLNINK